MWPGSTVSVSAWVRQRAVKDAKRSSKALKPPPTDFLTSALTSHEPKPRCPGLIEALSAQVCVTEHP
jgi:hypothetical protein